MKEFLKSFVYAFAGVRVAIKKHRNFKIQLLISLVVAALGFYLNINGTDWAILMLTIALVLGLEMVNTAIEGLVDLVTLERKPLPGKIKDIAAGAVLLASILAVIVGIIVFAKYLNR